ncbi:unnamed protein product [Acidithrix sp. C25]|nr:unnamed protein product [Acidithrix sp. C25]CAG4909247.1 unnamed protein product [Acidithrix sp. C25]CAG4909659.1 unnamed protein product [Acidithrix sp. C25]
MRNGDHSDVGGTCYQQLSIETLNGCINRPDSHHKIENSHSTQ